MIESHPLSCIQELMLAYSTQFGFGASAWNQQIFFELALVDEERIASVLLDIGNRHDILRTSLAVVDGSHRQCTAELGLPLEHRSLSGTREEVSAAEIGRPFDLLRAPLWRSAIISRPDGSGTLIVTFNHLLADRQSDRLFAREFVQRYDIRDSVSTPAPSPHQYSDFARWQRATVEEFVADPRSVAGWSEYEESIRSMPMPREYADRSNSTIRSECTWSFSRADTARIVAHSRTLRSSVNSMMTAAMSTALARTPQLQVGLLLGERSVRYPHRFADTLGPFPDPWPINTHRDRSTDFSVNLGIVRRRALQAIDSPLPFHTLLGRIPWLTRAFGEHGAPVKMFLQFFGDEEFTIPHGSNTSAVAFPWTFGEHSDVFGIHAVMGLDGGALRADVTYRESCDGIDARGVDALADAVSAVVGRQCGHPVRVDVAHHAPDAAAPIV